MAAAQVKGPIMVNSTPDIITRYFAAQVARDRGGLELPTQRGRRVDQRGACLRWP